MAIPHRVLRAARLLAGAALLAALQVASPALATNVALLVGVGDYADTGVTKLLGPRHDVEALGDALVARWGFARGDIRTLVDRAATHEAIVRELGALEARSRAGDRVLVYFSGHGTSAENPHERLPLPHTSGAFVPADFPARAAPEAQLARLVLGRRDLRPVLERLEAGGREVFVIADSCYSGQAVRSLHGGADGVVTRNLLPVAPVSVAAGRARPQPEPYPYRRVAYLAAASDHEAAVDIQPANFARWPTVDGRPHGALTDALLRVLQGALPADRNRDGAIDYGELHAAVADFAAARGYPHSPQSLPGIAEDAEGLLARPVFGERRVVPAAGLADAERLRVRTTDLAWAERLRREEGVEVVATAPDVEIRRGRGEALLLSGAADLIGTLDDRDMDALVGRVRQLAWTKRFRRLAQEGSRALLPLEASPSTRSGTFTDGETLAFVVRPDAESTLLLVNVDADGRTTVLYPARPAELAPMRARGATFVPGTDPRDRIRVQPPFGSDFVFAFAFDAPPA